MEVAGSAARSTKRPGQVLPRFLRQPLRRVQAAVEMAAEAGTVEAEAEGAAENKGSAYISKKPHS